MTVSMQLTKRIYAGNGITRTWEIDFPLYSTADIQVFITSPQGSQTEVTSGFSINTEGNQLTYPTVQSELEPLSAGWTITLVRHTPQTQQIDLLRQGELDAEVLEQGYDKLTFISQELSEKIDRCIKYPVSMQAGTIDSDAFFNDVMSAKQSALTASSQAVASALSASTSATSAATTAQQAVSAITTAQQTAQQSIASQTQTSCQMVAQAGATAVSAAQTAQYYAEHTLGKTVGEVFYSQSALATDNPGALPLFTGETIANADQLYPEFYNWVLSHTELQISATDYEAAITTYGECPKYVIDNEAKTIRLPKLTNYIKGANTTDGITQSGAGLPNITGSLVGNVEGSTTYGFGAQSNGAFSVTNNGYRSYAKGDVTDRGAASFDASRSSAVYGASTTVTPAHTTLFPWVCAYNAAIPASTAQAAEFQAALTGRADTSLSNITDEGKITAAHLAMPSATYDELSPSAADNPYVAPADGYFNAKTVQISSEDYSWLIMENQTNGMYLFNGKANNSKLGMCMPVKKGDAVKVSFDGGSGRGLEFLRFYYAVGSESEKQGA